MSIDLSPNGSALPILAAAAVAVVAYFLSGKKSTEAAGAESLLDRLSNLIGGKGNLLPVLLAILRHKDELRAALSGFLDLLKKIIHPEEKPK